MLMSVQQSQKGFEVDGGDIEMLEFKLLTCEIENINSVGHGTVSIFLTQKSRVGNFDHFFEKNKKYFFLKVIFFIFCFFQNMLYLN